MGISLGSRRRKNVQLQEVVRPPVATRDQLDRVNDSVEQVAATIREGWLQGLSLVGFETGVALDKPDGVWLYKQYLGARAARAVCDLVPVDGRWNIVSYTIFLSPRDHPDELDKKPLMKKGIETTRIGVPERSEFYEVSPTGVIGALKSTRDLLPMTGIRSESLVSQFEEILSATHLHNQQPGDTSVVFPDSA